ncbi:MAG: hypothetical protein ACM3VT_02115, partial [Solirubrobacterales bacterium]
MRNDMRLFFFVWICGATTLGAVQTQSPADPVREVEIDQIDVICRVEGRQLIVDPGFEVRTKQASCAALLVQGDAVLDKLNPSMLDARLDYDPNEKAYRITWPEAGRHRVDATFIARGEPEPNSPWQRASLRLPDSRLRQIRLTSGQPDLEVDLPGALRVQRRVDQGQVVVEA